MRAQRTREEDAVEEGEGEDGGEGTSEDAADMFEDVAAGAIFASLSVSVRSPGWCTQSEMAMVNAAMSFPAEVDIEGGANNGAFRNQYSPEEGDDRVKKSHTGT